MNSISTLKEHQKALNSGNFGTQYLTVYSVLGKVVEQKLQTHLEIFLVESVFL